MRKGKGYDFVVKPGAAKLPNGKTFDSPDLTDEELDQLADQSADAVWGAVQQHKSSRSTKR